MQEVLITASIHMQSVILSCCFFLGYIGQSVFGIGGFIISVTLLGFIGDVGLFKEFIFLGLFTGITSTLFTLITDHKNIARSAYSKIIARTFPGTIIGTYLVGIGDNTLLLKGFALFLLVYSLQSLFFKTIIFPSPMKKGITFLGGIIQGLFGSGGVFLAMANKQDIHDKSQFRSTFALLFLTLNIRRVLQFSYQGTFSFHEIQNYRVVLVVVVLAIFVGYILHIRISHKRFHTGIALLMLVGGVRFLLL